MFYQNLRISFESTHKIHSSSSSSTTANTRTHQCYKEWLSKTVVHPNTQAHKPVRDSKCVIAERKSGKLRWRWRFTLRARVQTLFCASLIPWSPEWSHNWHETPLLNSEPRANSRGLCTLEDAGALSTGWRNAGWTWWWWHSGGLYTWSHTHKHTNTTHTTHTQHSPGNDAFFKRR